MPVIETMIEPNSPAFAQNREAMLASIAQLRQLEHTLLAKAQEAKPKFDKRGQLLPRERLNLLLDPGAPFLELASLAGYKLHDDKDGSAAGGGLIAGIGYVSGVRMLVVANNSAIKGGTISPSGLKKSLRLQQIAMENKLPVVTLAESGGANLNYAAEIFVEGARSFANQARMSAMGLPQITVVHGSATAGGAYQPGLSDYVVVVRGKAKLFLAGPPLLKAATGEVATDEELGVRRCTRKPPAPLSTWPKTMPTACASCVKLWACCPGMIACRTRHPAPIANRCTRLKSCWG